MTKIKKIPTVYIFLLVFISAAIFRITSLNLIEFKSDEAINLLLAARPIFGHEFAPGGTVSSVGILNPPLLNYLLLPMAAISLDPRFVSFTIALINSVTVGLLFLIFKKYYGTKIAFIASILMAFSPWMILYSRKIWMQDLLIVFLAPFIFSVHKIIIEKNYKYWIVFTASSLFLIQIHQASLFFVGLFFLFLLLKKTKINYKYMFLGLLIGALPLIPYFIFQLQSGCPDCSALLLAKNKTATTYSALTLARPFQLMGQGSFSSIIGNDFINFASIYPLLYKLRSIFYLEYLFLPLGVLIFFKKFKDKRIFVYPVVILPFLYFFLKIEPFMHYFIIIAPFLFLFLATFFSYLLDRKNKLIKYSAILILGVIISVSIYFEFAFTSLIKLKGGLDGDYGEAYVSSSKKINKSIAQYKDAADYWEIFLSSYIPNSIMYGYLPIPKLLYSYKDIDSRILILEEKLNKNPNDPRIKQELTALSTSTLLDKNLIDRLWLKKGNGEFYENLYKNVFNNYLSSTFKKHYHSPFLGFSFDYPEFWKIEETENTILAGADDYMLVIKKLDKIGDDIELKDKVQTTNLLNQNVSKYACQLFIDQCLSAYYPIKIYDNEFLVYITFTGEGDADIQRQKNFETASEELINSARNHE